MYIYSSPTLLQPPYQEQTLKWLQDALSFSYQECSLDTYIKQIETGEVLALGLFDKEAYRGFLTGKIIKYPDKQVFRFLTLGGLTMDKWRDAEACILEFVLRRNCQAMEAFVRPDGKIAAERIFGFKHQYSVMVKEV